MEAPFFTTTPTGIESYEKEILPMSLDRFSRGRNKRDDSPMIEISSERSTRGRSNREISEQFARMARESARIDEERIGRSTSGANRTEASSQQDTNEDPQKALKEETLRKVRTYYDTYNNYISKADRGALSTFGRNYNALKIII